ncbi:MAG TPA: glycosyltransferase family 10 [Moraxellaceae bacterium]|nr:glycosyltransferase family 10 [Moraxellaceae bacterium]
MTRVKFLSRQPAEEWHRYFADDQFTWRGCSFTFDRDAREYDWLVVYDELPPSAGHSQKQAIEVLACPRANTLLITTEPASIKCYGWHYTSQFGHVLTTQPAWALPHPHRHFQQAANHWFYGNDPAQRMSHDRIVSGPGPKTHMASMVGSSKAQRHTLHYRRFAFMQRVQQLMPEIDVYGRGFIPLPDKSDALDGYRYHLCVENHVAPHHWTEKLSDAFLGRCLPFYAGAPDAGDYFPEGSFVRIDMNDPEGAVALLRQAIAEGWYEQRLPLIEEARRRVLQEYHLFAVIERIVREAGTGQAARSVKAVSMQPGNDRILSRHALRRSPVVAVFHGLEKAYVRIRSVLTRQGT